MTRHVHTPLPRKTNVREGMSEIDRVVAETIDDLFLGRTVQCACGRTGFVRRHGKGIRWKFPTPEQKAKEQETA